jgi:hypothetical protein
MKDGGLDRVGFGDDVCELRKRKGVAGGVEL